jgi:hypothetical protein
VRPKVVEGERSIYEKDNTSYMGAELSVGKHLRIDNYNTQIQLVRRKPIYESMKENQCAGSNICREETAAKRPMESNHSALLALREPSKIALAIYSLSIVRRIWIGIIG